ncbi:MAG: RdgB/HAM1 family non-canonical purine NTP pyrophosphatase [Candidatus Nitrosocosmicus sp.]
MHTLSLYFASSNENKFSEIEKMLNGEKENRDMGNRHGQMQKKVKIIFLNMTIKEIQSDSIIEVAEDKVKKAFDIIKKPVIIEDDGLFIDALNGFPGVYSSFVFKTIGNKGILDLLKDNQKERRAKFSSIIAFYDGETIETFIGETIGHLTTKIFPGGWGFDPIFMPENEDKTYGQIDILKKNDLSHRSKSFRKFIEWYFQRKNLGR